MPRYINVWICKDIVWGRKRATWNFLHSYSRCLQNLLFGHLKITPVWTELVVQLDTTCTKMPNGLTGHPVAITVAVFLNSRHMKLASSIQKKHCIYLYDYNTIWFKLDQCTREYCKLWGCSLRLIMKSLKSQCHPKCFAPRGTFFIYEKSAIFLIVVKADLYLLPSLPLANWKH